MFFYVTWVSSGWLFVIMSIPTLNVLFSLSRLNVDLIQFFALNAQSEQFMTLSICHASLLFFLFSITSSAHIRA
ncbi:MAG: hypothetical protein K9W46_14030 [Candidatus Heimdallarchaeum endolithica]|uniref:Uncharacterized protein n=1 Tax=Candidatus Heimdallarchaeum endolithica TaxID=2876572 RepID=A0A9Y1BSD2_9ARCH|nr:MAG: hypothetical protein K9W46_14030 [Candidatus Heimdallarchaeum endolithica]